MYAEYTILPGEFASNISVYIDNPFESFSMQARDLLHRYVVLEEQNQTEISRILVPYLRQETEANSFSLLGRLQKNRLTKSQMHHP